MCWLGRFKVSDKEEAAIRHSLDCELTGPRHPVSLRNLRVGLLFLLAELVLLSHLFFWDCILFLLNMKSD